MELGLTQPLTEMSTRNTFLGVKGGRCIGLTTLPLSCADCLEIWEPQSPGNLSRPVMGLLYLHASRETKLAHPALNAHITDSGIKATSINGGYEK